MAFSFRRVTAAVLLALPTWALAQSSVTISGLLDLSMGETKPVGGQLVRSVDNGQMSTSWIGFSGNEDLGNGTSAVFELDSFLRADTGQAGRFNGDSFWSRNAWVGLNNKDYGEVTAGRLTTPLFVSTLVFSPFGDSFGYSTSMRHYFTSNTVTGDSGWNNAVMYSTPSLNGATFSLIAGAGEGTDGRKTGASVIYFSGPLSASLVEQTVDRGALSGDQTAYDFGDFKLFGQGGHVDDATSGASYGLVDLGATINVGTGKVMMQWGQINPKQGSKTNTVSLGYDFNVSKRTDLYAVALNDKVSGLATGHGVSVGIRTRF